MKSRTLLTLIAIGLLFMYGADRGDTQSLSAPPSRHDLEKLLLTRAQGYYTALADGRFSTAYSFFEESIKRDNPEDEYLRVLRALFAKVEVLDPPKIKMMEQVRFKESLRPIHIASTEATIKIADAAGNARRAIDKADWVWDSTSPVEAPTWHLLGGPMVTVP